MKATVMQASLAIAGCMAGLIGAWILCDLHAAGLLTRGGTFMRDAA